nr:zinc finger MYM-type protein 1-like [Setaria viridis]
MEKYYAKKDATKSSGSAETIESRVEQKRPRIELDMRDIVADPGQRKPIDDFHHDIRDEARRAYLQIGPYRPAGHKFPKTKKDGKGQSRGFVGSWFDQFDWLEYSVAKDAAYGFYCYLFKPQQAGFHSNDTFTKVGFRNWKNAKNCFKEHAQSIDGFHNNARKRALDFKNQRQSVEHVRTVTSAAEEEAYKAHLSIMLGIARFLLLQALAFRGHDESKTSRNKGNFMEMLEWYRKKDPKAALVTGENAPGNNQMSSPMVQKDLARACAEETSELIKSEIGDRCFAVLVNEARDASIKEQMAVVVRFVNDKGSVIERFLGIEHVSDTTSTSLKEALDTMLRRYGLSISKIRGQGYDGASNMRGQFHGLQRMLVVVSVAKCCGSTFDFFNYVTSIVNVVSASCKRKDQLLQSHHDKLVEQLDSSAIFSGRGKNQETSLARPGDTRWGTHHKTLARLMIMWSSVLEVLENISEDGTDGEKKLQPLD